VVSPSPCRWASPASTSRSTTAERAEVPARPHASVHSWTSTCPPRAAATYSDDRASEAAPWRAVARRCAQTSRTLSGSAGSAPPASSKPRRVATSTPRSTQSPTTCTANSGLPAVRVATWSPRSEERPSRESTSLRCSSRCSGPSVSSRTSGRRHRPATRSASSPLSSSSRRVATRSIGTGSSVAASSALRTNRSASPPCCTSSSRRTSGRPAAIRPSTRRISRCRSAGLPNAKPASPPSDDGAITSLSPSISYGSGSPRDSSSREARARTSSSDRPRHCSRRESIGPSPDPGSTSRVCRACSTTADPTSSARCAKDSASRLLPTPGPPRSTATRASPVRLTSARAAHSRLSSRARPTRGSRRRPNSPSPAPGRPPAVRRLPRGRFQCPGSGG